MNNYIDVVYEAVKRETEGFDALYEDYIIHVVGTVGLTSLLNHNLLETCGVIDGRQLYVLCNR